MTWTEAVALVEGPLDGRTQEIERDPTVPSTLFFAHANLIHQYEARGGGAYFIHVDSFDKVPEHYGEVEIETVA